MGVPDVITTEQTPHQGHARINDKRRKHQDRESRRPVQCAIPDELSVSAALEPTGLESCSGRGQLEYRRHFVGEACNVPILKGVVDRQHEAGLGEILCHR